ncbi:mitochondrial ribonuclease P protein 1 homolog isoform X2 [Agrilus planipennis]|uniref:RNA (guanine-9-)-methyltransferase domain-containing protein 1 n=1 Tax=Agrilus planipennis TaxID=224129 RepID=A0A1W4XWN2_AGRPL|nr:mitochondrial ribonuclease P protein 1 homolog isoform X2 [Agrilus planipennis]
MLKYLPYPISVLRLGASRQPKIFQRSFSSDECHSEDETTVPSNKTLDIKSITNGDPQLEHKFKVLLLETEVLRQEGCRIPSNDFLKEHHWKQLLQLDSKSARRKLLEFTFRVQKKRESQQLKKELKRKERGEKPLVPESQGALIYDLSHNSMLLRVYDSTIDNFHNWRALQASMFGQKIVIDCGYDTEMTVRENSNCAKQLMYVFSENRKHDDPFDVYFCNMKRDTILFDTLKKSIPTMDEPWFPMNVYECSYLDLFPKDKLVYLTPHCREVLYEYDHDAIYIIGAIVDKTNPEPLSLAKAKKEGLKMAKLPLDRYLQWSSGSGKSLAINHVINILLDIKTTGDWHYALQHVPTRKVEKVITKSSTKRFGGRLSFDKDSGLFEEKKEAFWKPKWLNKSKDSRMKSEENNTDVGRQINIKKILND